MKIHVFIGGRVQGVFFRANTLRKAEELGINGWVRNLEDGRVEVVAEGSDDKIKKFTEFLKRGPPSAKVTKFEIKKHNGFVEKGFKIL